MVERIELDKYRSGQLAYHNQNFLDSDDARPVRLLSEFLEPKTRLESYGIKDSIVFFGSARIHEKKIAVKEYEKIKKRKDASKKEIKLAKKKIELSKYYDDAVLLSKKLTEWSLTVDHQKRFIITTGGGPGIMEAANRGAHEAGGVTLGFNITLPHEQFANPYILKNHTFQFHYFFMRKFWFSILAKAMIIFPGGFGTLDEFFTLLTLSQTNIVKRDILFILHDEKHWKKLINFDMLIEDGLIEEDDMKFIKFTNSVDEAYEITKNFLIDNYVNNN